MRAFIILLLLAAPLAAQTGDCTLETGTSTTWEIIAGGTGKGFVDIRWTFHAAGLLNQSEIVRSSSLGSGVDATEFADSQCESVDESRTADELQAARDLVDFFGGGPADPETVQPAYPEVCDRLYANPANAGGTSVENCRKAEFHQSLIREVWPDDALIVFRFAYGIWDWLQRNAQQGGAAFNTGQQQAWLNVTTAQWSTQVNPRMGNQDSIASGLSQDPQWQGELE